MLDVLTVPLLPSDPLLPNNDLLRDRLFPSDDLKLSSSATFGDKSNTCRTNAGLLGNLDVDGAVELEPV